MRLVRLDLEKYGAFADRSIQFRPDALVHVVYGPNEAGKSSALAAVADLLFGFGPRTGFAFRHDMKDLRLGATIRAADGRELRFRRRKGAKSTLIGPDDAPLRDDLLAPFLGALGRDVFERAFGLSAEGLRQGVADLLAADGDSGASLFAAASGLCGVEDLRRVLEQEADGLFSPQARKRPFNELLNRFEAAQKTLRERELGATAWKRLNESVEALGENHRDLGRRRAAVRTERARIERLARAHGAAVEVDQAQAALDAVGDALDIPPEAARALTERLDAADAAAAASARAAQALDAAEAEHAAVAVDHAILDAAEEIDRLIRDSGAYLKSQADLPRVQRDADARADDLARLSVRLGLSDGAAIESAMPTDAARAALRELIAEGRALADAQSAAERHLESERERFAALVAERASGGQAADPGPLRDALGGHGGMLRSLGRRDEMAAEERRESLAIEEAAARLSPSVDDLGNLATRSLPAPETIARARRGLQALAEEAARSEDALRRRKAEAAKLEADLARLVAGSPIASGERIAAARHARDATWGRLRDYIVGGAELGVGDRIAGVAEFDRRLAEADRLADRAAEDATRAARQAELTRLLGESADDVGAAGARLAEIRAEQATALADWRRAWAPAAVAPLGPEEMDGWLKSVSGLLDRRSANAERSSAVARLDAADAALRPSLETLALEAGVVISGACGSLALADKIEARLAGLAAGWQRASRLAIQIDEVERRLEKLARDRELKDAQRADWEVRWSDGLPALGLAASATLSMAEAALAAWAEAPAALSDRAGLVQRVRGMRRDAEAFREGVGRVVMGCAADLADLPPEAAARRLCDRLTSARREDARLAEATRRRDDARRAAEGADRAGAAASAALAEAASAWGEGVDLRLALARVEAREAARARLLERQARLATLGETSDEAGLRADLADFDVDGAPARAEALHAEERHLDDEGQRVFAELDRELRRREEVEAGGGAEQAAAERQAAGAALSAMAREWAVLKVAGLLLGAAVERARLTDRSPTLDRAAALFATLTDGAFAGFAEDYEGDAPTLAARRAGGETVRVTGLSEGTRDQFYLALRLAHLEDYAARAEPAPFIGDDLFASFDDARTACGLKALAEIGGSVQPILFTHHRAVVDIALATLGERVDVVSLDVETR